MYSISRLSREYERILAEIDQKRSALKEHIAKLEFTNKRILATDIKSEGDKIAEFFKHVDEVLSASELTDAEKRSILLSLIQSIKPEGDGYSLEFKTSLLSSHIVPSVQMISIHWPPGASR